MITLIPIVGMVIGLGMLAWAFMAWRKGEATRQWPSVEGEIAGVQAESSRDSDGNVDYKARVTYRYSVRGRIFDGSRVAAGGSHYATQSQVERYRPGMKVRVFHDPADPANGVLEVGAQYTVVALLLFLAATFIGISLALR